MQILKNVIRKPPPPQGQNDVFKGKINEVFPNHILKSKMANS